MYHGRLPQSGGDDSQRLSRRDHHQEGAHPVSIKCRHSSWRKRVGTRLHNSQKTLETVRRINSTNNSYIFTAPNEVMGRLCFYTCLSVILFTGGRRGWRRGVCGETGCAWRRGGHAWQRGVCVIKGGRACRRDGH